MEIVSQPKRSRPAYYFSWLDEDILDDHIIALSCDEDTWLYKMETANINGQFKHFQRGSPFDNQHTPPSSCSVDSRTYTRRKHCSMQPSLQSVVESPFSNRSSLGLLSPSKLLNDTLQKHFMPTPTLENLGKISSNSIVSDTKSLPKRIFKLDSPFMNSASIEKRVSNYTFDRVHLDSESSDVSIPQSLENLSSFEKNDVMTDSLVNFLEKREVNFCPPTAFQDEGQVSNSLISLPENSETNGKSEPMSESMVNFLAPVNCKPPCGFEDNDMTDSVINIDETNSLPECALTQSVLDYLKNVNHCPQDPLIESTASSETENIPPHDLVNGEHLGTNHTKCSEGLKASGDGITEEIAILNSTYELENNGDETLNLNNKSGNLDNITFTNSVNISRQRRDNGDMEDGVNIRKAINTTFDNDFTVVKDNIERHKSRALNNKDLNVTCDLKNDDVQDLNSTKIIAKEVIPNKIHATIPLTISRKNGTFKKSELNEISNKHLPSRNSIFNTTFTKLESQDTLVNSSTHSETKSKLSSNSTTMLTKHYSQSHRGLNTTFAMSTELLNGGIEDDQTSSASDSSFSSGSTKPRSVDELRTIAQQQESSLVQQTSTPTDGKTSSNLSTLDLELSPIKRLPSGTNRCNESRSANSSPVRSPHPRLAYPHPVSQLQHPSVEFRRQSLQASSLSNIARPKMSGLRMPQPVTRFVPPQRSIPRPATAPVRTPMAIPRPQVSRLPMPRFRGSGIPGPKRGGLH